MIITVVDTGANPGMNKYIRNKINIKYDAVGNIISDHEVSDDNGHGSFVCSIIRSYYNKAVFDIFKIIDSDGLSSSELLTTALKLVQKDTDLLVLALSTPVESKELRELISKIRNWGIVIVASKDNHLNDSYPASYPEVIGVKTHTSKKRVLYITPRGKIQISVLNKTAIRLNKYGALEVFRGNSKATADIAGLIALIITECPTLKNNIPLLLRECEQRYTNIEDISHSDTYVFNNNYTYQKLVHEYLKYTSKDMNAEEIMLANCANTLDKDQMALFLLKCCNLLKINQDELLLMQDDFCRFDILYSKLIATSNTSGISGCTNH